MTRTSQDGMLPENYAPSGDLTRVIWEAWIWLDRAERFYGGQYTLGDFARRLSTRAPTVWTWLSRATRPSYMMALAIIAIYPPAEFRRAPKRVLAEPVPQSKRTDDHPMWHREAVQVGDLEVSLTAAPSRQTWSHDL